ncbi:hypothetical protein ACWF95_33995 [Streptomyces vinaceus]
MALLTLSYLTARGIWRASERARKRVAAQREATLASGAEGHQDANGLPKRLVLMALCSMSVSLHGMWGFAREQAALPEVFAVGFLGAFDLTELVLFTMIYQRATRGWTVQLRLMHDTAWGLVAVSALANWIHAPSAAAAPFLAAMPIVAAWVIELEFRARVKGAEPLNPEVKPGPVKLLALLWTRGWAAIFSGLDLDPTTTSGQMARAVVAKKAAKQLFRLRTVLETHAALVENREVKRRNLAKAVAELDAQRRRTTRAMNRSDFAVDSGQALAVLRELAGWTRVDDVATVDTSDTVAVTSLMEEVAILPSAQRIEAAERAGEAEAARERAEVARLEAEQAAERAADKERAATDAMAEARTAQKQAEDTLQRALAETEAARKEAARAEAAREEAEAARKRAEKQMSEESRNAVELAEQAEEAEKRLRSASSNLTEVQRAIDLAAKNREAATDAVVSLKEQLARLEDERVQALGATRSSTAEAARMREQAERLQGELANAQDTLEAHRRAVREAADQRRQAEDIRLRAAEDAERTQSEAREARALLESLRPQLADRLGGVEPAAAEGRAFQSEAKQAGWELYLATAVAGQGEPAAEDFVREQGISPGNARTWLVEFRRARASMIAAGAARQVRGDETPLGDGRAEPRAAREEPRGHRADDGDVAEAAAQVLPINGQPLPV